jgi:putative resolvase
VTVVGSDPKRSAHEAAKVLAAPAVTRIVVEHRIGWRASAGTPGSRIATIGRIIVVLNPEEVQDDLVRDMTEVLILMCARLYGRRLTRKRADAAIRATGGAA